MTIFLDRLDSAPLSNGDFSADFAQWISVLINVLNEVIEDVQNALNILNAPSYTAAQIASMFTAGDLTNGVMLYDTTNNEYVGMISGALVKFTTTSYP